MAIVPKTGNAPTWRSRNQSHDSEPNCVARTGSSRLWRAIVTRLSPARAGIGSQSSAARQTMHSPRTQSTMSISGYSVDRLKL
jgi:hypothetical protein